MTCTGCQQKVHDLLSQVAGVKKATVDFVKGSAEIEMSQHISTQTLNYALKGYPKYQLSGEIKPARVFSMDDDQEEKKSWFVTYKPILLIFGYITAVSVIVALLSGHFSVFKAMRTFMAGFFIIFSFFKMLDLQGFADSYSMYDLVAKRFRPWGYIYAFIELGLGLAFIANFQPVIINWVTLIVMTGSIVGVLQSVLNGRKIRCACLGAVFNLPMSTVTIFEDALMIWMSITMLIMMW
jgi:copper chaperone CopZ